MARTVYDQTMRDHLASIRKIAQTDPWFAVGDAIGSALSGAYANNYNNRGINKAVNKALEEYGAGPNVEGQQAALQQVQQDMAQQPAGVSVGMSDADALNSVRQNYGLGALQPSGPAISAGNVPQQDPQMMDALLGAARAAQPETREQAITRLAQMPGATLLAQDNAARRLDNFNKAEAMARAQQQMIKDGRTPYQIEQAMAMLEPHFNRMQDDSYRLGVERIAAELGATDENGRRLVSDNEYKQRVVDLATKYGDIGKAAANVYGRDIVSGREQWNAQQQEARENRQFGRQVALDNRRFAQQNARDNANYARQLARDKQRYDAQRENIITRGQYGYGRGAGNTQGGISKEDITWAEKTIQDLEGKLDTLRLDNPQANLSQSDIEAYNLAMDIRSMANQQRRRRYGLLDNRTQGNNSNESSGFEFDPNNYNHQARALLGMIRANKGVLDDKLAEDFREIIGLDRNNTNPDEMTNRVINDMRAYRNNTSGKNGLFR